MNLSPREEAVARLFLAGKSNHEIASELDITTGTVGTFLHDIRVKIGSPGCTQATLALSLQAILTKKK